jgi:hypothetical protein
MTDPRTEVDKYGVPTKKALLAMMEDLDREFVEYFGEKEFRRLEDEAWRDIEALEGITRPAWSIR